MFFHNAHSACVMKSELKLYMLSRKLAHASLSQAERPDMHKRNLLQAPWHACLSQHPDMQCHVQILGKRFVRQLAQACASLHELAQAGASSFIDKA